MPQANTITIGCDPEWFIINDRRAVAITATDAAVEGTKDDPISSPEYGEGFAYHRDNVMIEAACPPTSDAYQFQDYVNAMQGMCNRYLRSLNPGYSIYRHSAMQQFSDAELAAPEAREFGCEPDNDAYEGGAQRIVPDGILGNYRTAGGHIHIGTTSGFNCPSFIVALMCDLLIGPALARGFAAGLGVPNEGQGFMWYRKPGLYREKEYGIEYRTPSNLWTFDDQMIQGVHNQATLVGKICSEQDANVIRNIVNAVDWVKVRSIIMGQNRDLVNIREFQIQAMSIVDKFSVKKPRRVR